MLIQCLFAVCMLAIVIVGLLVMTQFISLKELGNGIGRGSLAVVIAVIVFCVLKGFLLPTLISWLVGLKQMLMWVAIFVFALVIAVLVIRMLISRFQKWFPARGSRQR